MSPSDARQASHDERTTRGEDADPAARSGHAERVDFTADDGTVLTGSLFAPPPNSEARGALVINSGTGIPRRFYARFAAHAARRGIATLTYDYRGIGDSLRGPLRDSDARYRDWGQRDIPGALAWMQARYPALPLYALGHSTGGQQLGLAHNVGAVRAALFIAVSTGYWRGMPVSYGLQALPLFGLWLPLMTRLRGYAPFTKVRFGEDLPAGVAREWADWCFEPDYMAAYFDGTGRKRSFDGRDFGATYFARATFPIRAYCFTDDRIATRANVPPLLALYGAADVEERWIEPSTIGARTIDHLGFFRANVGAPLWDEAIDWLAAR